MCTALANFPCPRGIYASGSHQVVMPGWADELTPAQRAALEPAHFYDCC